MTRREAELMLVAADRLAAAELALGDVEAGRLSETSRARFYAARNAVADALGAVSKVIDYDAGSRVDSRAGLARLLHKRHS